MDGRKRSMWETIRRVGLLAAFGAAVATGCGDNDGVGPRFVDNGDGTVTDRLTALTWEKKSDDGSLHDQDLRLPWAGLCPMSDFKICQPTAAAKAACEASTAPGMVGCDTCTSAEGTCSAAQTVWTWVNAVNAEDGTGFAGFDDWRLAAIDVAAGTPMAFELDSLINPPLPRCTAPPCTYRVFNRDCEPDCTVLTCSCTQPSYYWSATSTTANPALAWTVFFGNGFEEAWNKHLNEYYVRAVRGGS